MYYAKAFSEFARPIFASLHLGNTASFEEMLQQRQAVGNTVSNLIDQRFEPPTPEMNMLLLDQLACKSEDGNLSLSNNTVQLVLKILKWKQTNIRYGS